jgi:hypothetical protein
MMNRWHALDRKAFMTALGTAGLGLGLIAVTAGGAPVAFAQEESATGDGQVRERLRSGEMQQELYGEFTAALADELGIGNADEVDAAIRVAMMTVVDARVDDGLLSVGQAEALKTLIATSEVPLGPGPMFGPPPGAFMRGGHGPGEEGSFFRLHGEERESISNADEDAPADDVEDSDASSDENANGDSGSNENDPVDESS